MKLQKLLVAVLMLAFVAGLAAPALAQDVTITGMVEKVDNGYVITAEDGQYKVEGYDLAEMEGKKVNATGTVAEAEGAKVITVTAVEAAE